MNLAFVFPGQGAQSVGMMSAYGDHAVVRDTFAEASAVLGMDLWQLAQHGPEDALDRTVVTQPLMLTAGVAVWRLWQTRNAPQPAWLAGHSLAEYSALVAGGALQFEDAVRLIQQRARLMQDAVPEGQGAMAAILGLDDADVAAACAEGAQGEALEPANFNSPGQVVIAGVRAAVERGIEAAKARGAKRAVMLAMSVPSHCSLLRGAADQLAEALAGIPVQTPAIPVIHNVDMQAHDQPDAIRSALVRQLYSPVQWSGSLRTLAERGVVHVAECGPGKVLAGLCRRIDARLQGTALHDAASLDTFEQMLQGAQA